MSAGEIKRLPARFFENENGTTPVLDWLRGLCAEDKKSVGETIKTVEFGWPVGLPVCRPISNRKGLWEVRADVSDGKIARVFFCIDGGEMVLLHGIIKKSQKTPKNDLDTAVKRQKGLRR
ncbi:type II toxin-antitoxin system RelE/ParE family toxin [uncultured Ruegeria sp.]|uniref:type II toxin-antitoxin system RelE/ParE family toxin n=1 Tax=uncultured Ruegeria sp. TaxID=259304 RepID=UPI002626DC6D|nr:type II toxin-antitoxin system RelE/ParE family toxin [uncultured Ruegeria sp.]